MRTFLALALVAAAATANSARAEDFSPRLYGRVELGYSSAQNAHIHDKDFATGDILGTPGLPGLGSVNHIGDAPALGLGVGYRYTPWLRTDVTVNYRGNYRLNDFDGFGDRFQGTIRSWAVMVNGYLDAPVKLGPLRPFIGAGVGWAHNEVSDLRFTAIPFGGTLTHLGSGNTDDVAWQAMLGLSLEVSSSFAVEVAFRHVDSGRIETAPGVEFVSSSIPTSPYGGAAGRLRTNEFVLSIRQSF